VIPLQHVNKSMKSCKVEKKKGAGSRSNKKRGMRDGRRGLNNTVRIPSKREVCVRRKECAANSLKKFGEWEKSPREEPYRL